MSPTTDQQLAGKLQKLAQELTNWREAMCVPGPGCACTGDSLCALHAAVYNQIGEAIQRLGYAIDALGRET